MEKTTTLFEKFKETGKHGIIYGIGSILEKAITIILLPLYTTRFTTAEYGILGLVVITGSILTTIFTIGMDYGLIRSYYDYKNERDQKTVISTAFFVLLASSILMAAIGFVLSKNFSNLIFRDIKYQNYFIIIIAISVLNIMNVVPFMVFRIKKKSIQFVTFQIISLIVGISIIIYLVNFRKWGVLGALTGQLSMTLLLCVSLYIYIRKELVFKISKIEVKKMLLLGLPLIPADIGVFVFSAIDRYFLNYYSTTSQVGLYNLAYNFGSVVTVLVATPISLIWPAMYLSVKDHSNAKQFYSRAMTYALTLAMFFFLVFSLLAKEVLRIFSNPEFWAAYAAVPIIVFTYSIWSLRKVVTVAVMLKRKTKGIMVINLIGAAINIGLNFLLIPRYGMMGAAYATISTYAFVMLMMYFYNQSLMKLNYEGIRILKIALTTAAIFLAGYFVVIDNLALSIIFKIVIILLYPLILWGTRFFNAGELNRAKQAFGIILSRLKRRWVK